MKKPHTLLLLSGWIVSLGVAPAGAQTETPAPATPAAAAPAAEAAPAAARGKAHRASILQGSRVDNHLGRRLGTVSDVIVNLATGEVAFLLVREGLTAVFGDARAVPPEAFSSRPFEGFAGIGEGVVLTLQMDQATWERGPTVAGDQIAGLHRDQRAAEIYTHYGQKFENLRFATAPAAATTTEAQAATDRLVSADEFMRTNVADAEGRNIGRIDDMIVDLSDGQLAFVILRPDTTYFEAVDAEFAVAPQAIAHGDQDGVQINLTEAQLQEAQLLTEPTLKERATEISRIAAEELRKTPPVYRLATR